MWPRVFTLGNFFLPAYGLFVAVGFLAGLQIAGRQARRSGLSVEMITSLAVYCALAGLAGAKLLMFVFHPAGIFTLDTLLSAGVFHGGLLAAMLTAWLYARKQKLPGWTVADVLAPGLAAGHAIGRLGCFAAGCCWGARCDRPWAVTFTNPDASAITGVPLGIPLHPTQLYESAGTLLVFLLLLWLARRPHRPGTILGWYLVSYSLVRVLTESFRDHQEAPPLDGPFTWTQWIALAMVGAGLGLIWRRKASDHHREPSAG